MRPYGEGVNTSDGPSRRTLALLCGFLTVGAVGSLLIALDRFLSGRIGFGVLYLFAALAFGGQAVYWFRRHRGFGRDRSSVGGAGE